MKFTSGRLAPILNNQIILGSVSMKISGSIISFSEDPTFSLFNEWILSNFEPSSQRVSAVHAAGYLCKVSSGSGAQHTPLKSVKVFSFIASPHDVSIPLGE